jgi:signal transduction histidine kinase
VCELEAALASLRRSRAIIEAVQSPAEHDRFPKTMSLAVHELRTPVTVVCGYLRMVLKEVGGPLNDKQKKMLQEAERSCDRIGALVAEMSDLGKLESRELSVAHQDIDLTSLVEELASGMHEGEDRGVRLDVRVPNRPVTVTGDRARLSAAITTLLHAALRERGEPGIIVADLTVVDATPPSAVLAIGEEDALPSLITAGLGTPPPFDEWRGGLGLALPVARRVIEALGGALWSAPGERPRAGSAFKLPLRT